MKSLFTILRSGLPLIFILAFIPNTNAQIWKKIKKRAKETVERKLEEKTERETEKQMDSILYPEKKGKQPKNDETPTTKKNPTNESDTDIPDNTGIAEKKEEIAVYSKFDFVPGDKLLYFDDFADDFVGDFPSKWNTNGGGEVVMIDDARWFDMKMSSYYIPDVEQLPEEYTIEFDIFTTGVDTKTSSTAKLHFILDESDNFGYGQNAVYAYLPFCQYIASSLRMWGRKDREKVIDNNISVDIRKIMMDTPHISVAVNKERFRLWINEKKYVDIPRIVPAGKITTFKLEPVGFKDGKERLFITNLKIAEGGIDLRKKLISQGNVSTNGILFDSGSSNIQPQSMGIIRQIYQVLQQEGNMKLKIIGHTDADGADDTNMKLSKARAEAVKNTLISIYGVSSDRLVSEGKGESEPIGDNNTADGKAKNRRVEFIKL
ncbi:OmpA family protein [Costertonia aggregata]|uniref:OmpA family protein n=1 Tax=Costertonia aggregata TaxID=343403 RepID=A0A7H9AR45_9FLAO|nr:OmpA family protein [Costertonia aggregata]QLG45938.1 OmpA family protein [Costertonia aggregata]